MLILFYTSTKQPLCLLQDVCYGGIIIQTLVCPLEKEVEPPSRTTTVQCSMLNVYLVNANRCFPLVVFIQFTQNRSYI